MQTTAQEQDTHLVFSMVVNLVGEGNLTDSDKAILYKKCQSNAKLRNLALLYLVGNSNRAELNLHRLHTAIIEEFFPESESI